MMMKSILVLFYIFQFSFCAAEDGAFSTSKSQPRTCPSIASQIPIELELEVIPGLSQFVNTFQQELQQPGFLRTIFERAVEVFKNEKVFRAVQLSSAIKFGMRDPSKTSNNVADSILFNLDIMKPSVLAKGLLQSVGRVLYDCGVLTLKDAAKLSLEYADAFKKLALLYGPNDPNEVFLSTIEDGALVLFAPFNMYGFEISERFAQYFTQEMYAIKNNV